MRTSFIAAVSSAALPAAADAWAHPGSHFAAGDLEPFGTVMHFLVDPTHAALAALALFLLVGGGGLGRRALAFPRSARRRI